MSKRLIAVLLPVLFLFLTALVADSPPKPPATLIGPVKPAPTSLDGWKEVANVGPNVRSWRVPYELATEGACFVIVAYDIYGNESKPSEQVCLEAVGQ